VTLPAATGSGVRRRCTARPLHAAPLLAALAIVALPGEVRSQELEPGAYTVSPVGVNFVGVGFTLNSGDVTFDPSLPVEDASATINTLTVSYGRAIGLAGRSATVLFVLPLIEGEVRGLYLGEFTRVERTGLGDTRLRLGVNLYGAPARRLPEFVRVPAPRTNVSVSLTAVAPTGRYDASRVINLGTNRWAFKPEVAFIRTLPRWMFEVYASVWLFTPNDDFLNGHERTQDPLFSTQVSARRTFKPGLWLSVNGNFYTGGRTSVEDRVNLDFQRNSRVGSTLAVPISRRYAIRVAVSRGAYTTVGADFFGLSVAFQRAWGGGL
jgi:hypothetical protein